jgi:hypothetical protein
LTILDKVALILNRCGVRFLFLGHTVGWNCFPLPGLPFLFFSVRVH